MKPLREDETVLLTAFDTYFTEIIAEIVPLTRAVIDHATELRAHYGFKTPDAIHLACAMTSKCDLFLTNDKQLQKQKEIAIRLVGE